MVYARNRGELPTCLEDCLPTQIPLSQTIQSSSQVTVDLLQDLGDGGETTDDEPTIRPDHSCASSETQSINTLTSEDTDTDADSTHDACDFH